MPHYLEFDLLDKIFYGTMFGLVILVGIIGIIKIYRNSRGV